jgi:hypothetical protein
MIPVQKDLKMKKIFRTTIIFLFFLFSSNFLSNQEIKDDSNSIYPCHCPSSERSEAKRTPSLVHKNRSRIASDTAEDTLPSEEELNQTAEKMENLFDDLESSMERTPRDTIDPQSVADKLGSDPESLFNWVKDNTYYVPYRGCLRAAVGVLMDRLGNSLDRALLLHRLLILSGYEARLAHGILTRAKAEEIIKTLSTLSQKYFKQSKKPSLQKIGDVLEAYSEKYQVSQEKLWDVISQHSSHQEETARAISRRAEKLASHILSSIKKDFLLKTSPASGLVEEEALDHWWVQYRDEPGWIDLDPTLADSEFGEKLTEVQETTQPEELDESLRHRVTISLVIEQWIRNKRKEHRVLSQTFQPSELIGKRINLYHSPQDWPENLDLFQEESPLKEFKSIILEQKKWTPVLQVDSDQFKNLSFTSSGEIIQSTAEEKKKEGGGLFSPFSSLTKEAPEESLLTAEWVEYEIYSPENSHKKVRRQIFDLLGPGARRRGKAPAADIPEKARLRRNLALLGTSETLILCSQLATAFVQDLVDNNLLDNEDAFLTLLERETLTDPQDFIQNISQLQIISMPLYQLALTRYNPDSYIDSPNILVLHSSLRESDQEGGLVPYEALDIVENEVAAFSERAEDSFQICLKQGVHDSIAESVLSTEKGRKDDLMKFYEEIEKQDIQWLTLKRSKDQLLQKSTLPEDIMARIESQLSQGYLVLVPEKEVMVNGIPAVLWWRINPETGNTLIIGPSGWGQTLTQFIEHVEVMIQVMGYVQYYAGLIICVDKATSDTLAMSQRDSVFYSCIMRVICGQLMGKISPLKDYKAENWLNFILKQLFEDLWTGLCKK